jgi:hypothetical protein
MPSEESRVTIARTSGSVTYICLVLLVLKDCVFHNVSTNSTHAA